MTRFSYDACGRLLEQTAADGTLSSLKYDDVRNAITATDAQGNSLYYDYSPSGRLRTVTDEVTGAVVGKITYNDRGQPVMTFDANGNCRLMEYDLTGRILSVKIRDSQDKLLSDQRAAYDEAATDSEGNPGYRISLTQRGDTQDLTTNYYFDSRERLIAQEKPYEGQVQRAEFSYDLLGNQISQTNFEGETSLSEYNVFGNILKTTDPSGISSTFDYDSAGNCTASSDGLGNTIRSVYDEAGRPILKILPYSETGTSETRLYYDNSGNLIKSIDPEGAVINRAYSETGKLTSVEHVTGPGASIITRMEYDAAGNMLRLIQGMDSWQDTDVSVTNYTYDRFGRMLTEADPAGKVTRYAYDNNGNLTNKVDRNAVATVYSYDGLNRPTQIRNSKDGDAGRISYSYNLSGSRTGMQDETGETIYLYDEWNRLSLINYGTGIEELYSYDLADRLTAFTLNQGSAAEIELKYDYDPAGRVSTVSDGGVRMESAYDAAGRLILENNGFTGISTNYSYDPMGNLESLKSFNGETLLDSYSYSYDKRGNQTQKIENGKSTAYYYDPLSRIKTVESEGGDVIQYDYTDLGNIASSAVIGPGGIAETLYSYDQANRLNMMETSERGEVTSRTFAYDPEGNQTLRSSLTSRDGSTITSSEQQLLYNGLNRLDTVMDQDNGITSYLYNGDGFRTSRDVNGEVTRYVYDRGNIVLETDGDYRITATNVRDSRQLNYLETGDKTYFSQFNGHGDVTKLLDLSGSVVKDYSYDPYGNEKFSLTPSFGGNISTTLWQAEESTIDNPFRYCGEYLDRETGFYYLRARDYDPATQRFLTEDSYSGKTSVPLSLNTYAYCQGNPIRYIDPSGYSAATATWSQNQLTYLNNLVAQGNSWAMSQLKSYNVFVDEDGKVYSNADVWAARQKKSNNTTGTGGALNVDFDSQLDSKYAKVKQSGCAITSASMIFNFFGANTGHDALFKAQNNSVIAGWSTLDDKCGLDLSLTDSGSGKYISQQDVLLTTTQSLNNGVPVITRIRYYDSADENYKTHFIVIYGISNSGDYLVRDPGRSSSAYNGYSEYLLQDALDYINSSQGHSKAVLDRYLIYRNRN